MAAIAILKIELWLQMGKYRSILIKFGTQADRLRKTSWAQTPQKQDFTTVIQHGRRSLGK
jgi:hypothetical protein